MADYEPEVLHKLWAYELDILKEFDRVCKKHDLKYFCAYGTALGAIRHKGFIPWDDDIDVGMPREDYEKLVNLPDSEWNDPFELQEARKTKGYALMIGKLINKNTTFIEATDTDRKYKCGIFVDIFPFDYIQEDAEQRLATFKKTWLLARLCVLSEYPKPKLPATVTGMKRFLILFACQVMHYLLLITGQNKERLYKRYVKAAKAPAEKGHDHLLTDLFLYNYEDNYGQTDVTYKKEVLLPTVEVPFEDASIIIPGEWDAYLKRTFGDYMQMPPVDKRHAHKPSVLNFDQ